MESFISSYSLPPPFFPTSFPASLPPSLPCSFLCSFSLSLPSFDPSFPTSLHPYPFPLLPAFLPSLPYSLPPHATFLSPSTLPSNPLIPLFLPSSLSHSNALFLSSPFPIQSHYQSHSYYIQETNPNLQEFKRIYAVHRRLTCAYRIVLCVPRLKANLNECMD